MYFFLFPKGKFRHPLTFGTTAINHLNLIDEDARPVEHSLRRRSFPSPSRRRRALYRNPQSSGDRRWRRRAYKRIRV